MRRLHQDKGVRIPAFVICQSPFIIIDRKTGGEISAGCVVVVGVGGWLTAVGLLKQLGVHKAGGGEDAPQSPKSEMKVSEGEKNTDCEQLHSSRSWCC